MDDQTSRIDTRPAETPRRLRRGRSRPRNAVVFILALAVIGLALWLHPWTALWPGGAPQPRGEPPQAIGEATVATGDLPIVMNALGTVTPLATVTVQTQINGQLTEIGFKEGQMVKKGDFLAQIDPRPFEAALESAQGTLAKDQALLKQAQIDLARFQTLNRQDSIAKQQVDDQFYLVRQDEGTVRTDQAAVDTQKLNLAYCHIVSPVDGRVGLRLVDAGNYVQTSTSSGLVVITQIQPITVIFTLPEDALPQVLQRLHTGAKLPVIAYDRSNTTKLSTGMLETVDNQIDTTTGTVKLRATFTNEDGMLFPNQFVNARLLVDTLHDAVLAPNPAVQQGAPGAYVYLVGADNTVSVRPVKLGPTDGEHTAVLSGLSAGDKVVVDGADRLRDGAKVIVPASTSGQPRHPHAAGGQQ
jgi:membrane fusion protein, multidrug efflux system